MNYERSMLEDQVKHFLSLLRVERNLSSKTVKAYHSDLNGLIHWLILSNFSLSTCTHFVNISNFFKITDSNHELFNENT